MEPDRWHLHLICLIWVVSAACASEVFDSADNCRPPSISSEGSTTVTFIANTDELMIPCIASGTGTMDYKWLKNGETIAFSDKINLDGQGNLKLKNPEEKDKGFYQCTVSNKCGTALTRLTKVSQRKLEPFPPVTKPEEKKVVEGSSLILYCDPPYSNPKALVSWELLKSPNEKMKRVNSSPRKGSKAVNTVELDGRINMDDAGNLYITNVQKEDEKGGSTYICNALNEETRSGAKGSDKIIKVIETVSGEGTLKRPPDLMWHNGDQIIVQEGQELDLKCIFSGNPVPEVTWQRLDGRLDKDHHYQSKTELYISQVLPSDEGTYECTGKNIHGPKSATINVKVESVPQWQDQPLDVTVGPGEGTEIKCRARGVPEPKIEWFINGKPIGELKPDKWNLDGHVLRFEKLEMSDSKVIQCNASNTHGYIFADVYLFVEAMAPVIERPPLEVVVVAEERELHLKCETKGKPKPTVVWYKGGQPLKLERYQYQDIGDLIIANTDKKDSGKYRCKVTNRFGSTWGEGEVLVREKTQIFSKPIERNVTYNSEAIFMCGAKTDVLETDSLKYSWLKNGSPLTASSTVIIEQGKLTIKDTTSKDSGNYTCVAGNGLDSDSASAMLRVKAKPDAPQNVKVPFCEGKKATITWYFDDSMSNYQAVEKFVVESLTKFDEPEGRWKHATDVPFDVPATASQKTTNHEAALTLSAYTEYKFRVLAVNALGSSAPSEATYAWCQTPRSLPAKHPDNVHTDEQYTGYLVVKWDPLEQIDLNGPNFTYMVDVQKEGQRFNTDYYVDDYTVGEWWLNVTDIYHTYYLRVWSKNLEGSAVGFPKSRLGYSGEGVPLVTPENFELDPLVNVTATSATFRWDGVNTTVEAMQGKFSGYKIRFWKKGEKETTMRSFIVEKKRRGRRGRRGRLSRQSPESEDEKVRGTVANLPSFVDLEADVVVINKNFESNGSNVIPFRTPEGVPGPVAYFEAINRGSHHFLLHWAHPKEANGVITRYQISYRKIKKLDFFPEKIAFSDLSPDTVRVILKGLEPSSQYRVYIKAFTKIGEGKEYFIDVRTNSDVVDIVLPVILHVDAGETGANVTFEIPSQSKSSRYGQLYKIEYKKKKSDKWEMSDEPVDEGLMWGFLDHLKPNEQYQVRVLALAHDGGDSRPSEPYTFKTAGFGYNAIALRLTEDEEENGNGRKKDTKEHTLAGAKKGAFLTAAWFIGMMVAIAILILFLIIVCIIKRNRGDNYPVQEKERLRGNCDDTQDHFNGFGKPDENGLGASSSFDQDVEKVPLDAESDSLDYGDDDASKFNEDGSFIGQYGRGEKSNDPGNSSSIV